MPCILLASVLACLLLSANVIILIWIGFVSVTTSSIKEYLVINVNMPKFIHFQIILVLCTPKVVAMFSSCLQALPTCDPIWILTIVFSISEVSKDFVELPPELCSIVMMPISDSLIYSFSFITLIMHQFEWLLGAFNLKKMHLDHCAQNEIATIKVCYNCSSLQSRKVYICIFFLQNRQFYIFMLIVLKKQKKVVKTDYFTECFLVNLYIYIYIEN